MIVMMAVVRLAVVMVLVVWLMMGLRRSMAIVRIRRNGHVFGATAGATGGIKLVEVAADHERGRS